jgi:CRP-like cAMP-binding protein
MTEATGSTANSHALLRRLERFGPLTAAEVELLDCLERSGEWAPPDTCLISEGESEPSVVALLAGLAYRHKDFRDGRRQIIGLLMPGEICGRQGFVSSPIDYGVRSLTRVRIVRIESDHFMQILREHPTISRALQRATLVEQAIQRAWTVNLGQRQALERMAHLLCELAQRMSDCGLLRPDGAFEVSLTQGQLGSVLGLTSVHVNRILQKLRAATLIDFDRGLVRIHDIDRLRSISDFNPAYLSY